MFTLPKKKERPVGLQTWEGGGNGERGKRRERGEREGRGRRV